MTTRIVLTFAGAAASAEARADHSHHHDAGASSESTSAVTASLGLLAAQYSNDSFVGDYQGATPSVRWADARFAVSANIGFYRLTKNGAVYHGPGDAMVHGQATMVGHSARSAGVALAVSAPTGSDRDGLGMGHVMLMPALWGSWSVGDVTVAASGGYGRALGASNGGGGEHVHGSGPIVDPMNFSELTWSASGELAVAKALRLGARVGGAFALGEGGTDRTIGAVRALWSAGRVATSAELQVGLVGEPFNVRGIVETALRF